MASLVISLEEIVSVAKQRFSDRIPDYIKGIKAEDDKIIISAYKLNVGFTFESFEDGIIIFKVSSAKFLKFLFNLFKGEISDDYISVTSSRLTYRVNSHLKSIDKNIEITGIEKHDKQFHINVNV